MKVVRNSKRRISDNNQLLHEKFIIDLLVIESTPKNISDLDIK